MVHHKKLSKLLICLTQIFMTTSILAENDSDDGSYATASESSTYSFDDSSDLDNNFLTDHPYFFNDEKTIQQQQLIAYEDAKQDSTLGIKVQKLQAEYLMLMEIFNDFAGCVDEQGEMIHLVFECSKSTFETLISSMIRLESARQATMTQPWLGYSTWTLTGVASIVLGLSGGAIPAVIIATAGAIVGSVDVGYNSYSRSASEAKTSQLIMMGSSAMHTLDDHFFDYGFASNPYCPHAGSATSYELHRQMKALIRVEKIFQGLLGGSHKSMNVTDKVFERLDDYQEKEDTTDPYQQLEYLSMDLDIDEQLAKSFSSDLDKQNALLERVLYLSSKLNGKVLANDCEARKILRRI